MVCPCNCAHDLIPWMNESNQSEKMILFVLLTCCWLCLFVLLVLLLAQIISRMWRSNCDCDVQYSTHSYLRMSSVVRVYTHVHSGCVRHAQLEAHLRIYLTVNIFEQLIVPISSGAARSRALGGRALVPVRPTRTDLLFNSFDVTVFFSLSLRHSLCNKQGGVMVTRAERTGSSVWVPCVRVRLRACFHHFGWKRVRIFRLRVPSLGSTVTTCI